jgi:hypothetical protein
VRFPHHSVVEMPPRSTTRFYAGIDRHASILCQCPDDSFSGELLMPSLADGKVEARVGAPALSCGN